MARPRYEMPPKRPGLVRPESGGSGAVAQYLWGSRPVLHDNEPLSASQFKSFAESSIEGLSISLNTITRMAARGWLRPTGAGAGLSGRGGRTTYYRRRDVIPLSTLERLKQRGLGDAATRAAMDAAMAEYAVASDDEVAAVMLAMDAQDAVASASRLESALIRFYADRGAAGVAASAHVMRAGTVAIAEVLDDIKALATTLPGLAEIRSRFHENPTTLESEKELRKEALAVLVRWLMTPPDDQ